MYLLLKKMTFLHRGNKEHEIILHSEMSAATKERSSSFAPRDAEVCLHDSQGALSPTTGRGGGSFVTFTLVRAPAV